MGRWEWWPGGGVVKKDKESACYYHCRGCALRVWVACSIKAIQVVNKRRGIHGGIKSIVEITNGRCPKRNGSRAEPAIVKTRVKLREL